MKTVTLYRWSYVNAWGKRGRTTFACTEEEIRLEHPDAEPIFGTKEVRVVADTDDEIGATGHANLCGDGAPRSDD